MTLHHLSKWHADVSTVSDGLSNKMIDCPYWVRNTEYSELKNTYSKLALSVYVVLACWHVHADILWWQYRQIEIFRIMQW